ncbi:hypothetical protein WA158_007413 [Blastocystis sp. Blastoise]
MAFASRRIIPTLLNKSFVRCFSAETGIIKLPEFPVHKFDVPLPTQVQVTKDECMRLLKTMIYIRRMEIENDPLYTMRKIKGFLHLYDGEEEACGTGIVDAIKPEDDYITSYRCHGIEFLRAGADKNAMMSVFHELLGHSDGAAHGKGGSMHMYEPSKNFWGGSGIVAAQVPVGTGIALANKYTAEDKKNMNICVAAYGDGASNQGQVWEAANMAKLWDLPVVYVIENNSYAMGTSVERGSSSPLFYKMGKYNIPGIQANGHDIFSVREVMKVARQWASQGNGPIFVETYRYHGHSMSDPGVTYRTREEIEEVRKTKDCIQLLGNKCIELGFMKNEEFLDLQSSIRKEVKKWALEAVKGSAPDIKELYTDVYTDKGNFIRGVEYDTSVTV